MQNADSTDPDYKLIAKRIQRQRAAIGITQEKVADRTGLAVPTISNIENGKKKPSLTSLYRIAHALATPLEFLVEGSPNTTPIPMKEGFIRFTSECNDIERRIVNDVARLKKVCVTIVAANADDDDQRKGRH